MTLPHAVTSLATFALSVSADKFGRYLLDPSHPTGGRKAAFFLGLGFTPDRPSEFADALVEQAWNAREVISRPHPRGYGIEIGAIGPLRAPDGRVAHILTAWNWRPVLRPGTEAGTEIATFVTAYPRSVLS